eukprot:6459678-Amphidinium_carterae.1
MEWVVALLLGFVLAVSAVPEPRINQVHHQFCPSQFVRETDFLDRQRETASLRRRWRQTEKERDRERECEREDGSGDGESDKSQPIRNK